MLVVDSGRFFEAVWGALRQLEKPRVVASEEPGVHRGWHHPAADVSAVSRDLGHERAHGRL